MLLKLKPLMLRSMKQRGFTIVELLITITIMGILLALGTVVLSSTQVQARDDERKADVQAIQIALESFYASGITTLSNAPNITNLAPNPGVRTATTGWSVAASGGSTTTESRQLTDGPGAGLSTFYRRTVAVSPTGNFTIAAQPTGTAGVPVSPNTTYTFSAYMRTHYELADGYRIDLYGYDAAGSTTTNSNGVITSQAKPGSWQRVTRTLTTDANTNFIRVRLVYYGSANAPVGTNFDATGVMVTTGTSPQYGYQDGNSVQWNWNGSPVASTSTGPAVVSGSQGTYPNIHAASETFFPVIFNGFDVKSFTAPGQEDNFSTFITATNAVQTTDGVQPQPTTGQYVYQPIDNNGVLCTDLNCRKYNIFYRLESDNAVHMVTSRHQ